MTRVKHIKCPTQRSKTSREVVGSIASSLQYDILKISEISAVGSAPVLGTGGHWFESNIFDINAILAQW